MIFRSVDSFKSYSRLKFNLKWYMMTSTIPNRFSLRLLVFRKQFDVLPKEHLMNFMKNMMFYVFEPLFRDKI